MCERMCAERVSGGGGGLTSRVIVGVQDFDWDAAVAEIDDVCLRSQKAATAVQPDPPTGGATDIDPATAATWIYPGGSSV